ncbi:hypothetical protein BKA61DRAFT_663270 [Leptodontidium sp. MPI-SDFR-AT-0119]|nr:hypothetical protein BKA61DRAFT_663270 [Leptodontidium sp. MPI-SDFR-AT-0119]
MAPPTPRPVHRTLDPMRYSSSLLRFNQHPRKHKAAPRDSLVHGPESSESKEEPDKVASKTPQKPKDEEPKWEDVGTEFVKLIVGKESKEFSIHKSFICKASVAMNAAFCSEFEEVKTGVMTLDEDDPLIVQDFVAYSYPNFNVKGLQARTVSELVGLYIFADRYRCANRLKNNVMDALQDKMATQRQLHLSQETMERIFDSTTSTKEAPIRKFCAALMTFALFKSETVTTESLQDIQVNIPELHLACLNYQREVSHCKSYGTPMDIESDPRKRGGDNRRGFGECYFHIHTTERACDD